MQQTEIEKMNTSIKMHKVSHSLSLRVILNMSSSADEQKMCHQTA